MTGRAQREEERGTICTKRELVVPVMTLLLRCEAAAAAPRPPAAAAELSCGEESRGVQRAVVCCLERERGRNERRSAAFGQETKNTHPQQAGAGEKREREREHWWDEGRKARCCGDEGNTGLMRVGEMRCMIEEAFFLRRRPAVYWLRALSFFAQEEVFFSVR